MNRLKDYLGVFRSRLGFKLALPVLAVLLVFSVPYFLFFRAEHVTDASIARVSSAREAVEHLDDMVDANNRERIAAYEFMIEGKQQSVSEFQAAANDLQHWHTEASAHTDTAFEATSLDECEVLHNRAHDIFMGQIVPAVASGQSYGEYAPKELEMYADYEQVSAKSAEVEDSFKADLQQSVHERTEVREFASESVWISMIAAIVVGLAVAGYTGRRFLKPIVSIGETARNIARGDLDHRVTGITGHDELAMMGNSFNDMADSLQRRTEQLEQEKTRIRSIHQSIGDGIIVVDRGGSIISVNPAAERVLGQPANRLERTTNTGIPKLQHALARTISEDEMLECWEVKDCHKTDCPSHGSPDRRCWLQCGTFCYNQIQGTFRQKRDACERCDVFMHNAAMQFDIEVRGRHYSTQVVPILDDDGQEEGRTIVLHDVTDLQNAKEEVERSAGQLSVLNNVSKAAASSLELKTMLGTSLESVLRGTMADAAFIHTTEPGSSEMVLAASLGVEKVFRDVLARIQKGTGCPGHVIETGEAVLENDLVQRGETARPAVDAGFLSYVGAPLRVKKTNIGAISLLSSQADAFTEEDKHLVTLIGNQIGVSIENANLYSKSMDHALREQARANIVATLTSSLDLQEILDEFAREINQLVDFDRLSIVVPKGEQELEMIATAGAGKQVFEQGQVIPRENSAPGWVMSRQKPYFCGDTTSENRFFEQPKLRAAGIRSHINMPLIVKGQAVGTLNMSSMQKYAYGEEQVQELGPVVHQLAMALANQKLFKDVARAKTEWETTFDSVSEGIVIVGVDHTILRLNKAAARMVGGSVGELAGKRCFEVIHRLCGEPLSCPMKRADINSEPTKTEQLTADGRTLELVIDTMFEEGGRKIGAVHFLRDITEAKRLRTQLLQSEKMVAVGQLVSGVAHEINNPLTGVAGYAQLLLAGDIDEKTRKDAEAIYTEAERATRIVRQLLSFARKHQPERTAVNINKVIEESLSLKAYDLKVNNIKAETRMDPDLPLTEADPHQLQQVFLNLITNAEQAMLEENGEGLLKVTTGRSVDGSIRVVFSDNGPGIPEEIHDRIFDPFFTTKEVGKGTGLGLSVCFGVVQDHGGRIWPEAVPGGGASMFVELPVVAGGQGPAVHGTEGLVQATRLGRILLVDDEESIRDVLTETLKQSGHSVDSAENGEAALRMLKQSHYDCVVSDIKMPGMDGRELHQAVQDLDPGLAGSFVFISGDTVNPETQTYLNRLKNPFLSKPFEFEELETALQKVLSGVTRKEG